MTPLPSLGGSFLQMLNTHQRICLTANASSTRLTYDRESFYIGDAYKEYADTCKSLSAGPCPQSCGHLVQAYGCLNDADSVVLFHFREGVPRHRLCKATITAVRWLV